MARSKPRTNPKAKYDEAVKDYTPEQLDSYIEKAKQKFIDEHGEVSIKVLARTAKVPQKILREHMAENNWAALVREDPGDLVNLSKVTHEALQSGAEKFGLTEKEELFCYHYMKTFNATTAAVRAGYSPLTSHNQGNNLLQTDRVKDFLRHVKGKRNEELFVDAMRVMDEYIKIAFADMTDFVKFGPGGVMLKSSDKVDGQLITKVKEGRDGVSIELADKMAALAKLEKYLGVMPEDWRLELERRKVDLMEQRLLMDKEKADIGNEDGSLTVNIVRGIKK